MQDKQTADDICPKCGSPLNEIETTKTGKQLQRCSAGKWNPSTKTVDGCDFVKWIVPPPVNLEEKCPKCGSPLLLVTTKFGKKLKRCSTNKWDPKTRETTGCDFVEWIKGTTEELDETCPKCGAKLVLYTSAAGKKLKKCSTNKWDPQEKASTGCDYVQWI